MELDTTRAPEGTQSLAVTVSDLAGKLQRGPVCGRPVDNTPPARVDAAVAGGSGWRSRSYFEVSWANPAEADRAPIVAATYKLCPVAGGECRAGRATR